MSDMFSCLLLLWHKILAKNPFSSAGSRFEDHSLFFASLAIDFNLKPKRSIFGVFLALSQPLTFEDHFLLAEMIENLQILCCFLYSLYNLGFENNFVISFTNAAQTLQ